LGVEVIRARDGGSMLHKRESKTIGFEESGIQGITMSAEQGKDHKLSYTLTGHSPQGEEDTLSACRILVNTLNKVGGNWHKSTIGDGVIDCQSVDRQNNQRKLWVQVVHAVVDTEFWKALNLEGKIKRDDTAKALADQIKSAIDAKANDRRISKVSRRGLVLALDATRLPALVLMLLLKTSVQGGVYGPTNWASIACGLWDRPKTLLGS